MTWRIYGASMLLSDCFLGREPMDGVGVLFMEWLTETKHSDFWKELPFPCRLVGPVFLGTVLTCETNPGKGDGGAQPGAPSLAL